MDESRALVQAEIRHAKEEVRQEVRKAKLSGILFGVAGVLALCGLAALFVALGLALPWRSAPGTAAVGVALLVICATCAFLGLRSFPKRPLNRTREHASKDLQLLKEVRT